MVIELPSDTRSEDVSKFFDGYGKIIDCRVMTGWLSSPTLFYHPDIKNFPRFWFCRVRKC